MDFAKVAPGAIVSINLGVKMVDVNPEIWNNPTLGAAAHAVYLDVMDAQVLENRCAEIEGRHARIAKRNNRYPGWTPPEATAYYSEIDFGHLYDDGSSVQSPQGGPEVPASGIIRAAQERSRKAAPRKEEKVDARWRRTVSE